MAIVETDLAEALQAWGDGLVAVSEAYDADGIEAARPIAADMLDDLYAFDQRPVLFKPTLASGDQTFRPTKQGALSYFVAHDAEYPLDGGFALKSWRSCRSETAASFIDGDVAMWMGWVTVTDKDGQETKVDKSFGYQRDADGVLRIVLHHSSLPFQP